MIIYGIKNCDTCRKAMKALGGSMGAELHDVRDKPLMKEDLERFYDAFGASLVNTRSATWRGLDEAARNEDPIALLQQHPTLMKRPVIAMGDQLFLGWGKDVQAELLD